MARNVREHSLMLNNKNTENSHAFDGHLREIVSLLKSGKLCGYWHSFNGGENIQLFEKKFASYVGTKDAIAVSNGTTSIFVALLACGVKRGDVVAVSPYTHVGSVAPIVMAGAIPKFVDVDEFGNIDPNKIEGSVKAIVVAHQIGNSCDMDTLTKIAEDKKIPNWVCGMLQRRWRHDKNYQFRRRWCSNNQQRSNSDKVQKPKKPWRNNGS